MEVFPRERIVILEDTVELQCAAGDQLALRSRPGISLDQLVKSALRASPTVRCDRGPFAARGLPVTDSMLREGAARSDYLSLAFARPRTLVNRWPCWSGYHYS
jgi:hypothetical protein